MTSSELTEATEGGVSSGSNHKTLVHALKSNALDSPDHVVIDWVNSKCEIESNITYKQLWEHSGLVATLLVQNGVQRGDRVMISYPFGLEFLGGLFGCMRIGVIPCSVYPPNILDKTKARFSFEQFNNQAKDAGAKFALTSTLFKRGLFVAALSGHKTDSIKWLATDKLKTSKAAANALQEVAVSSNDIAFIQYSSGSTGDPKGVVITHRAVLHNMAAIEDHLTDTGANRFACWLPQYHDYGLVLNYLTSCVFPQYPTIACSPIDFIRNPLLWTDIIETFNATHTAAPNFAYALLAKRMKAAGRKFSSTSRLMHANIAAEPIAPTTLAAMEEMGIPKAAINPSYGLAEVCVFGTMCIGDEVRIHDGVVSCGLLERSELLGKYHRVASDDGRLLPESEVGQIYVRGPDLASGYWNKPELTERFHCQLSDGHEYFATGDLGQIVDGRLYVVGRSKELIIINGKNVYPQDVERVIESEYPDVVRPGSTVAFQYSDDDIGVVLEIRKTVQHLGDVADVFSEQAVRQLVSDSCGVKIGDLHFLKQGTIPKTTSGKLKRVETRQMSLEGSWSAATILYGKTTSISSASQLNTLITRGEEDVETTIKDVVSDTIDMDSGWEKNGLTSLMHAELISRVQEVHHVTLPINFQMEHETPNQLKRFIEANSAEQFPVKLPDLTSTRGWRDNHASLSKSTLQILQSLSVLLLVAIFAMNLLPAFYVGKYTSRLNTVTEVGNSGRYVAWSWLPVVLPTFFTSFSFTVILLKWIVIGRYHECSMDMPSLNYYRWWFVDRLVHMWEVWVGFYLLDTKLLWLFYRFMGADLSWSCQLNGFLREFDLVSVGPHSSIGHQMQCRKFDRIDGVSTVEFRPIGIGANCAVKGVVEPGVRLSDGSQVDRTSAVSAGSQVPPLTIARGSPAYNAGTADTKKAHAGCKCVLDAVKLCWLFLELYLFFTLFLVSQVILNQQLPPEWRYTPLLYWVLLLLLTSLLGLLLSIVMKWILIGRRRSDHAETLYRTAVYWICDYHFMVSSMLIVAVFPHSRILFNGTLLLHGMDIDMWSFLLDCMYLPPSKADMVKVKNSFVSARIHFEPGGEIEIVDSSIGLGVSIGKGVKIHGTTVRPQVNVRESVYEDITSGPRPAQSIWKLIAQEAVCLGVPILGFVSLIPAFELFNAVVYDERLGVAICGLMASVVVQLVTWTSLLWLVQRLIGVRGDEMLFPVYINLVSILSTYTMWFLLWGSPLYSYLLRFMGARVKGELWYFGYACYDFSFLTFEDGTIVDNALIIGHYQVYDRLVVGPARVGGVFQPYSYVYAGGVALNGGLPFQVALRRSTTLEGDIESASQGAGAISKDQRYNRLTTLEDDTESSCQGEGDIEDQLYRRISSLEDDTEGSSQEGDIEAPSLISLSTEDDTSSSSGGDIEAPSLISPVTNL